MAKNKKDELTLTEWSRLFDEAFQKLVLRHKYVPADPKIVLKPYKLTEPSQEPGQVPYLYEYATVDEEGKVVPQVAVDLETQTPAVTVDRSEYPHNCKGCGAPALRLAYTVDCSAKCDNPH